MSGSESASEDENSLVFGTGDIKITYNSMDADIICDSRGSMQSLEGTSTEGPRTKRVLTTVDGTYFKLLIF